mgnify:CR=1 FL=1
MLEPTICRYSSPLNLNIPVGISLLVDPNGVLLPLIDPPSLRVPPPADYEFVEYLAFGLPKQLERLRQPILIEELDYRFSRDAKAGLEYSLDLVDRITSAYRVQVIAAGSLLLYELWPRWTTAVLVRRDPELGLVAEVLVPERATVKL